MNESSHSSHFAEYTVEKKYEGAYGRKRILAIILYILGPILVLIGMFLIGLGAIAILVIIFLPNGIMGTLQKKLNFEIFSQKRFSEHKKSAKQ